MSDTDRADPGLFPGSAVNPSGASRRGQTEQRGLTAGILFHLFSLGVVAAAIIVTFGVISSPLLDLRKEEPANSGIETLGGISSHGDAPTAQLETPSVNPNIAETLSPSAGQPAPPTATSVPALGDLPSRAAAPTISETKSVSSDLAEPPLSSRAQGGAPSEPRLRVGKPFQPLIAPELARGKPKAAPSDGSQGEASATSAIPNEQRNEIFREFEQRNEIFREFATQLSQEAKPDPSPGALQRPPAQSTRIDNASVKSRIRKECGPIRNPAVRRECISSFGLHGPGR
jgi:hypothetical protein